MSQIEGKRKKLVLRSTPAGRQNVIDSSIKLSDGLLDGITKEQKQKIKYHSTNCYSPYVLKRSRVIDNVPDDDDRPDETPDMEVDISNQRTSRSASLASPEAKKVCIICNQAKFKGDIELWRICEINRAATFLAAFQFNQDDVQGVPKKTIRF